MTKKELILEIELVREFLNDSLLTRDYVEAFKYQKHLDKCETKLEAIN